MAINTERQEKWQEQSSLDLEYCTLAEAKKKIEGLIAEYGENAKIYSYCDRYSNSEKEYMHVMTPRLENDQEYNTRIEQETKSEERRAVNERAEFERLSKKFNK